MELLSTHVGKTHVVESRPSVRGLRQWMLSAKTFLSEEARRRDRMDLRMLALPFGSSPPSKRFTFFDEPDIMD